jgi:hypothetical protein
VGKVKQLAVLQPCGVCGAGREQPCVHKSTGKPIEGLHRGRCFGPAENLLNREVARIEGGTADEFFRFCWLTFRLPPEKYPGGGWAKDWEAFYEANPEMADGYYGEW